MANSNNIEIPLKVVIDREKKRVVFAEANSDFVDILFSFLTLPMGTIIRLLAKHSPDSSSQPADIGSFNNLYRSVADLEAMYFGTKECKDMLLYTRNAAEKKCLELKINVDDIKPIEYYTCMYFNSFAREHAYLSTYNTAKCKSCRMDLNRTIKYVVSSSKGKGVFATKTASFLISNDLHVFPNNPSSTFGILESVGITDFAILEENTLKFGSSEFLDLLQYSFLSETPLTDMYYGKKYISSLVPVPPTKSPISTECKDGSKKMTIKVFVQKSTNKILLAHSSEDFVDFLFSFLTIPLGRVIGLLNKDCPSTLSIENIYETVSDLDAGEYFKSQELKDKLLQPKLAMHYLCSNQIFPLEEATTIYTSSKGDIEFKMQNPKGEGGFLTGPTKFMVTDNLVVTPSSLSCIKYLQSLSVSPNDIEEQVINIGVQEGLNLLRASLTSASALTSGLEYFITKRPKQENLQSKKKVERLVKRPKIEK